MNIDIKREEKNIILPEIAKLITYKYFAEKHIDLDIELNKYESQIYGMLSDLTKPSSDILKDYISFTERCIKSIASNYTTYELLFWSRRIGPKNIFNVADLTVMLYREVQSLSFYKYGKSDENITIDENTSVFPKNVEEYYKLGYTASIEKLMNERLPDTISKTISDVIRLEILSFLYVRATQYYRIANKDCEIIFDNFTKKIISKKNEDIDFLINMYDERLSNANLFSMTGSYIDDKFNIKEPYFCPHFQLNVDHKVVKEIFNPKNKAYSKVFSNENETIEIETNYLLGSHNIVNIFNYLKLFEDEFQKYYSFEVVDFVLFLSYLGYKIVDDMCTSFNHQYNILNRAYTIANFNLKNYSEEFEKMYPVIHREIFKTEINHKIDVVSIFKRFLLEKSNKNDINLWTRGPKRFLYELSDSYMVIDYTCLTDIISYIVKEITSSDGEIGNLRADYFEESLKSEINSIYGTEKMWVCRGEITSGKLKKEIDASFIIDDVLFIVEAKAINVSLGFDKGDKQALNFRINKMKGALKEVDEKAEFIFRNKKNINRKLPESIKFICPLVISTYPEYIWSLDDNLFIAKELLLPRIITIPDIAKLKNIDLFELKKKKWIIELD